MVKSSSTKTTDNTTIKIKIEEGTDEVKVFSASSIQKNEFDVDIEDRLSPVVEEPTSPNKNDPYNNYMSGLYSSPFLYPYFMAAAAQANVSNFPIDKTLTNGQMNMPFGAAFSSFPGMPFYPPGMVHQPNLFNPFSIPMPTSYVHSSRQHQSSSFAPPKDLNTILETKRPKKPHIKKPLNAFMIYMKEKRAQIIEECTLKESSAINKILGQKWKELTRSEQDKYYELAKQERNRHLEMYPNWSARDNYGLKKKRQIVGVQKKIPHLQQKPSMQIENDCLNPKKCRARYGLEGVSQWCKHCRRKKKCTRFREDDKSLNPSSVSSSTTLHSDNEDSMNEPDSDDILSRQIDSIEDEHDDSNEENKQESYPPSSSQFPSKFHY